MKFRAGRLQSTSLYILNELYFAVLLNPLAEKLLRDFPEGQVDSNSLIKNKIKLKKIQNKKNIE